MLRSILLGAPRLKFDAGTNIVFDGNSLIHGENGTNGTNWVNVYVKPKLGFTGTIVNLGVGGQSWLSMTSSHGDVDSAYVAGKKNVLVVLEDTNNFTNGRTLSQNQADKQAYCTAVRASQPWRHIVAVTCSLRWSDTRAFGPNTHEQVSQLTLDANAATLTNYRALGFSAVADIMQAGSPLQADYNVFASFNTTYYDTGDTDGLGPVRLHWTNAAQDYVAGVIATTLKRLPGN